MLKIFRGVEPTTKIFYTKFFHNEIISFENFPDYGSCILIIFCTKADPHTIAAFSYVLPSLHAEGIHCY